MVIIFWDFLKPSAKFSYQTENFVNTSRHLLKNRNWFFAVIHYFTWKLEILVNILCMIVGKYSENFWLAALWKISWLLWFQFFLYFPAEFFEFSFSPRCKIEWPYRHLDRVWFHFVPVGSTWFELFSGGSISFQLLSVLCFQETWNF